MNIYIEYGCIEVWYAQCNRFLYYFFIAIDEIEKSSDSKKKNCSIGKFVFRFFTAPKSLRSYSY